MPNRRSQASPSQKQQEKKTGKRHASINEIMANSLLDNIKEDPSQMLRFQIDKKGKYQVGSKKDW